MGLALAVVLQATCPISGLLKGSPNTCTLDIPTLVHSWETDRYSQNASAVHRIIRKLDYKSHEAHGCVCCSRILKQCFFGSLAITGADG